MPHHVVYCGRRRNRLILIALNRRPIQSTIEQVLAVTCCEIQRAEQFTMNLVAPLDPGPTVLFNLDRDGRDCLHANGVFEQVNVSAVARFAFGRHAHADRHCPVLGHRTPVGLLANASRSSESVTISTFLTPRVSATRAIRRLTSTSEDLVSTWTISRGDVCPCER